MIGKFEPKAFVVVELLSVVEIGQLKAQLLWQLGGGAYLDDLEKNGGKASGVSGAFTIAAAAYKLNLRSADVRAWMESDELFAQAVENAMDDFLDLVYNREAVRALELGGQAIERIHDYRLMSNQRNAKKVRVTFNKDADSNL